MKEIVHDIIGGCMVAGLMLLSFALGRVGEMPVPQNTKTAPLVVRMEVCANTGAAANTTTSSLKYKSCISGVDGAWTVIKDK